MNYINKLYLNIYSVFVVSQENTARTGKNNSKKLSCSLSAVLINVFKCAVIIGTKNK